MWHFIRKLAVSAKGAYLIVRCYPHPAISLSLHYQNNPLHSTHLHTSNTLTWQRHHFFPRPHSPHIMLLMVTFPWAGPSTLSYFIQWTVLLLHKTIVLKVTLFRQNSFESFRVRFRQFRTIFSSLSTKMNQSHLLTLKSYWFHEKNLMLAFCWLAQKKWYELPVSYVWYMRSTSFNLNRRNLWPWMA